MKFSLIIVLALFFVSNTYAADSDIVINEINYNHPTAQDWVEIYNKGVASVDLTNWKFRDGSTSNLFTLPAKTLAAGEFLVICRDSTNFKAQYPTVLAGKYLGNFGFGLSNSGDQVRIFNASDVLIDNVTYDDNTPWPVSADGGGKTLELIHFDYDNFLVANWLASLPNGGTPSLVNSTFVGIIDTFPPQITNFVVNSNSSLTVTFDEVVDLLSSENETNYSLNNGIGNPVSAIRQVLDSTKVDLTFTTFVSNTFYTLTLNGVEDKNSNPIASNTQINFNYFATFDVVINEIHYNSTASASGEFIELYNRGTQTINLGGWNLNGFGYTFPVGTVLNANSYIAIVQDSTIFSGIYSTANFIGTATGTLQNTGETLTLFDNSTFPQTIDLVTYGTSAPWVTSPNGNGPSLELFDASSDNNLPQSWAASPDSNGTPGAVNGITLAGDIPPNISNVSHFPHCPGTSNSVKIFATVTDDNSGLVVQVFYNDGGSGFVSLSMNDSGTSGDVLASDGIFTGQIPASVTAKDVFYYVKATDNNSQIIYNPSNAPLTFYDYSTTVQTASGDFGVVINEVMYNSSSAFGSADWVELYNKSTSSVNISNWVLKDNDAANVFTIPNGKTILPNQYFVLCSDTTNFKSLYPTVTSYLGNFDFGFSGSGDQVRIYNSSGVKIDSLEYLDVSPWPTGADGSGPSLERDTPILLANYPESWSSSTTNNGTPGEINSVFDGDCNHKPDFTEKPSDLTMLENELLTFTLGGYDPNGDQISFYVNGLPSGATYDTSTKTFNWIPNFTQAGGYDIFVGVTDGIDTTEFKLDVTVGDAIIPTNEFVFFYGTNNTVNGLPIAVGDTVSAFDPNGVKCGEFIVANSGEYGFMPVYKDDVSTPGVDEGANSGDLITFKINGNIATILGPDTGIWTSNNDIKHVNLSISSVVITPITDLLISQAANNLVLNWSAISGAISYKIYRSINPQDVVSPANLITEVSTTTYTDTSSGTVYFYSVVVVFP
ncbi:lamin tail domain-containing protein [bacterium]|nr:lamin tail domain-containing protein [bacterium]